MLLCLLFSRLIHGNSEEYPASSCKEVRDFRTSLPPSEAYYINFTDPCTEESNITEVRTYMYEVNTMHMCMHVQKPD